MLGYIKILYQFTIEICFFHPDKVQFNNNYYINKLKQNKIAFNKFLILFYYNFTTLQKSTKKVYQMGINTYSLYFISFYFRQSNKYIIRKVYAYEQINE